MQRDKYYETLRHIENRIAELDVETLNQLLEQTSPTLIFNSLPSILTLPIRFTVPEAVSLSEYNPQSFPLSSSALRKTEISGEYCKEGV